MDQAAQLTGAVLILGAFVAAQLRRVTPASVAYLVPNAVGGAVLTASAWHGAQWGFVLLEAVWTVVSLWGLAAVLRGRGAG